MHRHRLTDLTLVYQISDRATNTVTSSCSSLRPSQLLLTRTAQALLSAVPSSSSSSSNSSSREASPEPSSSPGVSLMPSSTLGASFVPSSSPGASLVPSSSQKANFEPSSIHGLPVGRTTSNLTWQLPGIGMVAHQSERVNSPVPASPYIMFLVVKIRWVIVGPTTIRHGKDSSVVLIGKLDITTCTMDGPGSMTNVSTTIRDPILHR
jgi:hypothetical protein